MKTLRDRAAVPGAVVVTLVLLLVTGCATVGAPHRPGSLGAAQQLAVQPDGSQAWRSGEAANCEAVHIDPAAIAFAADVALDDAQRDSLRTALAIALRSRFATAGLPSVSQAGARGTASVRATVTAIELARPALNVVTTLLLFAPLSRGSLTVEIEAFDPVSGERIAGLAMAGRAGLEDFSSAYSATGHAELQADVVARRFVALVTGTGATP